MLASKQKLKFAVLDVLKTEKLSHVTDYDIGFIAGETKCR